MASMIKKGAVGICNACDMVGALGQKHRLSKPQQQQQGSSECGLFGYAAHDEVSKHPKVAHLYSVQLSHLINALLDTMELCLLQAHLRDYWEDIWDVVEKTQPTLPIGKLPKDPICTDCESSVYTMASSMACCTR